MYNSNVLGNGNTIATRKHESVPCIKDNTLYIDVIEGKDTTTATERVFKQTQVFENLKLLIDHINALGFERGFKVTRHGNSI